MRILDEDSEREKQRAVAMERFKTIDWRTTTTILGTLYPFVGSPFELIKAIVDSIPREVLAHPFVIREYARRIRCLRSEFDFSEERVAKLLGTSARAITDEEKGNKKKISPYFLLGFSLIYQVSPLFLVSRKHLPVEYIENASALRHLNAEKFDLYKSEAELLPVNMLKNPRRINVYRSHISILRENMSATVQEVAREIGVSPEAVQREEKLKKGEIDRYLLLGFALLYQMSPESLVGNNHNQLPNPVELRPALVIYSPEVMWRVEYILYTLYHNDENPEMNDRFLGLLCFIYSSPVDKRMKLCSNLKALPLVARQTKCKIDFPEKGSQLWEDFAASQKYQNHFLTICDAKRTLAEPGLEDIDTLTFFAQLTLLNADIRESIMKLWLS